MIEQPKKERRFLKAMGRVGIIILEKVLIRLGSNLIKKIGGKKPLPSILFLFLSISLFAQYPNTGNKQRLGFQTTGDGLTWRGSLSDTASIQPINNQNAWVILDTVNLKIYSFDFTSNVWNVLPQGTTLDTTSLSNRINLKVNISDTASMLTPYFRDADTTSLNLTSRFAAKLNLSDTASMLTNYLRSYTAASTYLTQSNAASTYLPLTGGTLTGALNGTTGNFSTSLGVGTSIASPVLYAGGSGNQEVHFYSDPSSEGTETTLRLTNKNAGFYTYGAYFKAIRIRGINEYHAALGAGLTEFLYFENTAGGAKNLGVFNSNPSYNFDLNGTFNASGNSLIGGTLGVTGATTLSAPLTVNSSAVFNEGSTDSDFRVESDGNANMLFVDASTDRVGIGTSTPSKTLEVNGEVKIATTTATPTSLLGKDGSNIVGEVTSVAQMGIMKAGGTTTNTSSVGIITVAHGLPYTPSQVLVTLAQQSSYVIVCHSITSSNMVFTVYDSTTGLALDNVSVGFFWLAIK